MKKKIVLGIFLTLYLGSIVTSGIILATGSSSEEEAKKPLTNIGTITGMTKKGDTIGVIKINGPIFYGASDANFLNPEKGANYWLDQLNYASTNDNIKAVVIQVNSPGGTVGVSQELHAAVARVKAAGKPVITSIADISASGGYYATVGSDRMFANPGSLVGSIGVIMGGVEISELLTKLGIKYQVITSGKNKDILSPYKALSEEQRAFLETMIQGTYEQFLTAVAEGRGKKKEVIRPLADGSIFTGEQAVANGLIDELGTFHDVIAYTKKTYNLEDAKVMSITPESSPFQLSELISVFSSGKTPEVKISFEEHISSLSYSPLLYLYEF